MKIKLLKEGYKKDENIHDDFINDRISENGHVSEEYVIIDECPDFLPHLGHLPAKSERKREEFIKSAKIIGNEFLKYNRDDVFNERFWHSYFCIYKRELLMKEYGDKILSEKVFKKAIFKNFDWENYIYKYIIAAQYIGDNVSEREHDKYYNLILDNLDVFNYIIKYNIFRNDSFLIKMLDIIDEVKLSSIMKSKIKNRPDLGSDERYGRRVVYEFNKSYPIVPAPVLSKNDIKAYTKKFLAMYYDGVDEFNWK